MNFNDLPLNVPNLEKAKKIYENLLKEIKEADTPEKVVSLIKKKDKIDINIFSDISVINIRYTIDTTNKEYKEANDKVNQIVPILSSYSLPITKEILAKPFRKEMEDKLGKFLFDKMENSLLSFDEKIIPNLIKDNELCSEHDRILGSSKIEYKGNTYTIAQLGKFVNSSDRQVRKEVQKLIENFFKKHNDELGKVYDEMVKNRNDIAIKMGFNNFMEYQYKNLGRVDYDYEDVRKYRDQIYRVVLPIYKKLIRKQAKLLGIKTLQFYDLNVDFKEGNPQPNGEIDELVEYAKKMYNQMSPDIGAFFEMMADSNLLSLKATPGKVPGGYMTTILKYKVPFIFANSNGTTGDVDTLTHEVGHAFQYYNARNIGLSDYTMPTLEACEIHSMSMEFLTYPYMNLFFNDDAEKYKYMHLKDAITILPYICLIDEFQEKVYLNVDMTHEQRCAMFRDLEKKWLPLKKYNGFQFYNKGTWWLKQGHVFNSPFYYIDYSLAQVVAFQFFEESLKNKDKTWKKYIKLDKMGGKYPFLTLLEKSHLRNPFIEGNVKKAVKPLIKILNSYKID